MRLSDCFLSVFAYTKVFLGAPSQGNYQAFRGKVIQLIDESKALAAGKKFPQEDIEAALFAVVAWVDETVMCSSWKESGHWKKETLQKVMFNTAKSGNEFFSRLDDLGPERKGVLEVYYICLTLGFKGKYFSGKEGKIPDDLFRKSLESLMEGAGPAGVSPDLLSEVKTSAYSVGRKVGTGLFGGVRMFPDVCKEKSKVAPDGGGRKRPMLTTALLVVGPAILPALLYFVYYLTLNDMIEDLLSALK